MRTPPLAVAAAAGMLLLGATASCGGDAHREAVSDETACENRALDERSYILCTAGDAPDQRLVIALHGRGSSAEELRTVTGLDRDATGQGMAVVYPDALDGGWGDDTFTTQDRPAGDEDLTFLDALIGALRADPRIDDQPVGLVGFSNGGSMALRFASARPSYVRAVVSVAGQLPRDAAVRPAGRVPILQIYGTADPIRPYDTGIPDPPARQRDDPTPTLSTRETIAAFLAVAGTPQDHQGPEETDADPLDGTRLLHERWTDGDGTVAVLETIVDGGHTWPSARGPFTGSQSFGTTSQELDASAEAITFVRDPDEVHPAGGSVARLGTSRARSRREMARAADEFA